MFAIDMLAYNLGVQLDQIAEKVRRLDTIPVREAEEIQAFIATARVTTDFICKETDPATADLAKRSSEAPARPARLMPTAEPGSNIVRIFPTMSTPTEAPTDSALTLEPQPT